jgi:RNA polymerase sigma-70 factor (ECF subfamily)
LSEAEAFRDLFGRVRNGDEQAAEELVRRYESTIRMAIRVRLNHSGMRRLLDSMDICQSVLGNFFVRAASGQFEIETPTQLVNLLVTMARNRFVNHAEYQQAARRSSRRVDPSFNVEKAAAPGATPSKVLAYKELLEMVKQRLSDEEKTLAQRRATGQSWKEIAVDLGEPPDTLRFRLTRALNRVARELQLDD